MLKRAAFFVLALLLIPAQAQPQSWGWDDGTVPYVNTPVEIVERMMRMARGRQGRLRDRPRLGRRPPGHRGGEARRERPRRRSRSEPGAPRDAERGEGGRRATARASR